jgi:predicted nucleic acid-binding protein
MSNYTVLFDACVMYPAPLRSYLMYLTNTGLFRAKWSEQIHDEWIRNLLLNNPSVKSEQLQRVRELMNANVLDAVVDGYEPLIEGLSLPDVDDRHVLAAAIQGKAETIVTFNLKDFPNDYLEQFDIRAVHPDEFLSDLYSIDAGAVLKAAQHHINSLKNPPFSSKEYLDCLQKQKLPNFISLLRPMASFLKGA